jgi:hypothetical protein
MTRFARFPTQGAGNRRNGGGGGTVTHGFHRGLDYAFTR